ncbi:GNAT family N-acetyltransferase [Paenibacillus radicis (ex Xue et al. 2023)]|uniref:GNAT family N-acetyltransferase n=1 Tax=Paenibacillus radicis (ex Xue et al. 2023) TaxID=2972489 RepID=A0ABT1YBD7_9BACL|nr:GNAT family N-acetyltransferase [Paenibacillus radicis (ex Xue et al. 2023)]MCR8630498.1 GNAT family N-acetyltransferase [Paenibacillus radicis (ex Xue et al. 2023)]
MYELREMNIQDYEMAIELWKRTEGMALSNADSRESIHNYLIRNAGMSFVCVDNQRVVGTILCGHDGRRGYIYHVAVDPEYRGNSIGKQLVARSLAKLRLEGIDKCHIMVIEDNEIGNHFWNRSGWMKRDGILLYSSHT